MNKNDNLIQYLFYWIRENSIKPKWETFRWIKWRRCCQRSW